jgi:chromosome segregation ATPase
MRWAAIVSSLLIAWGTLGTAAAADDSKNSREREMLRRAQEALRQSQTESSALAQSKSEAEQKLKAADAQLDTLRNSSKSEQAGLRAKLKAAADSQAGLTSQLDNARQQLAALSAKQAETAKMLNERETLLKRVQSDLDASRAAGSSCEAKNLKMYEYSQELARRYENKGVWTAMRQKEPVTGIGGVGMENLLQEYREKAASQRVQPAAPTQPASR